LAVVLDKASWVPKTAATLLRTQRYRRPPTIVENELTRPRSHATLAADRGKAPRALDGFYAQAPKPRIYGPATHRVLPCSEIHVGPAASPLLWSESRCAFAIILMKEFVRPHRGASCLASPITRRCSGYECQMGLSRSAACAQTARSGGHGN